MQPDMVVVVSLRRDDLARLPRLRNMCRLRHSSRSFLLKLSMNTLCTACLVGCSTLGASQASAETFAAMLPDSMNTGQVLELQWKPNVGLTIRFENQDRGTLNDIEVFQAAFNSVLGPCAPDGVPEGLIGDRPNKQQPQNISCLKRID
jgi:hypothetical protein